MTKARTLDEWVKEANRIAKEHGGVLPSVPYLVEKLNLNGLAKAIFLHPDRFRHIRPKKTYRTLEQWVGIAEQLAKHNGGLLPTATELKAMGYSGLTQILSKHPEILEHIPRDYSSMYVRKKKGNAV